MNIWSDDTKEIRYYERSVYLKDAPLMTAPEGHRKITFQPMGLSASWLPGDPARTVRVHGIVMKWGQLSAQACDFIYSLDGNAPDWIRELFTSEMAA